MNFKQMRSSCVRPIPRCFETTPNAKENLKFICRERWGNKESKSPIKIEPTVGSFTTESHGYSWGARQHSGLI